MFFKKKKEIVFWSDVEGVENFTPITKGIYSVPEWFKNIPKSLNDLSTVKVCPSFISYFKNNYIIRLWCDLEIEIREDGKFSWATPFYRFTFSQHFDDQFKNWVPEETKDKIKLVLKSNGPWKCKTPKNYILIQQPLYFHFNDLFEAVPGIIETDFIHEINIQLIFKKTGKFFIPRGTPLAMYFVCSRENFNLTIVNKYNKKTEPGTIGNSNKHFVSTLFKGSFKESKKTFFKD